MRIPLAYGKEGLVIEVDDSSRVHIRGEAIHSLDLDPAGNPD